ncbi:MAG: very short patch repair endonuclease [Mesorhizobium sp.]|nr:very short patch repair endonuclease [Mesorhizobium sp.]
MSRVAAKNTTPELAVRRQAHAMGLRFRLHRRDLPGCPDLVFVKYRTVVFVHGCFWHRHVGCSKATTPKSSVEYWKAKFERNEHRDAWALRALEKAGWRVLTIWECDTRHSDKVASILAQVTVPEEI